jgi:hypothetical protein
MHPEQEEELSVSLLRFRTHASSWLDIRASHQETLDRHQVDEFSTEL